MLADALTGQLPAPAPGLPSGRLEGGATRQGRAGGRDDARAAGLGDPSLDYHLPGARAAGVRPRPTERRSSCRRRAPPARSGYRPGVAAIRTGVAVELEVELEGACRRRSRAPQNGVAGDVGSLEHGDGELWEGARGCASAGSGRKSGRWPRRGSRNGRSLSGWGSIGGRSSGCSRPTSRARYARSPAGALLDPLELALGR